MDKSIYDKISVLCREIARVEWSGILLYSVRGSIREPKKMAITLRDIIPMHKGSTGYTEYQINEKKRDSSGYEDRMIDYFNENPIALEQDWKMGHIHSHHNMKVYFSGTDMEELEDNSPSYNYYLSLIVNNFMEFTAKVAFMATVNETITADYQALDDAGVKYPVLTSKLTVKKDKMFIHDCIIDSPKVKPPNVDKGFMKNLNDIIKKAEQKVVNVQQKVGKYPLNQDYNLFNGSLDHSKNFNVGIQEINRGNPFEFGFQQKQQKSLTEKFIVHLLMHLESEEEIKDTTVVEALDYLCFSDEDGEREQFIGEILDIYPDTYSEFFSQKEGIEDFIDFTQEIIDVLEEHELLYSYLPSLIMSLKSLIANFEKNGTTV